MIKNNFTQIFNTNLPAGSILPYVGLVAPAGFLLCDGTSQLVASYPNLFAILGYTYGGAGANFNLPDTRGRLIAMRDNGRGLIGSSTLGANLGSKEHSLTVAEIPSHDHPITVEVELLSHVHTYTVYYPGTNGAAVAWANNVAGGYSGTNTSAESNDMNHAHTAGSGNTGGGVSGVAHSNIQPVYVATRIIKL